MIFYFCYLSTIVTYSDKIRYKTRMTPNQLHVQMICFLL
jgi:hypothetical protein